MRTFLAMALGKTARFLLRLVRRGGGSALPGTIAAAIQPNLLARAIQSAPQGLVVVSGTAGKSSTTNLIVRFYVLTASRYLPTPRLPTSNRVITPQSCSLPISGVRLTPT